MTTLALLYCSVSSVCNERAIGVSEVQKGDVRRNYD